MVATQYVLADLSFTAEMSHSVIVTQLFSSETEFHHAGIRYILTVVLYVLGSEINISMQYVHAENVNRDLNSHNTLKRRTAKFTLIIPIQIYHFWGY